MAMYSVRLRRALPFCSSLLHHHFHSPKIISPICSIAPTLSGTLNPQNPGTSDLYELQSFRLYRSSPVLLSSRRQHFDDEKEITEDTILFEGCDYNHWLITVQFPEGTPAEEKISTYEQITTRVFGSLEEAKKKIYACSTTVYDGFQVECSEETSEKFKDVPGVLFVLPDSYIDPVNKQYGGDKYINGEIIHIPPPISYMRRDSRTRSQRNENRGPMPVYENRGQMQGGARNFGPPQNPLRQQNFGPPPHQQNFGPPHQQNFGPTPRQQNFGPPRQQNFGPPLRQQNFGPPQNPSHQQNFGPPQNPSFQQNFIPPQNPSFQQNFGSPQSPSSQQNFGLQRGPGSQQNHPLPQNAPPHENYGVQEKFSPQQNFSSPGMDFPSQQNYSPPGGIGHKDSTLSSGVQDYHESGRGDFSQAGEQMNYAATDFNGQGRR